MDNEAQLIIELKDAGFPIRELDGIHARVDPSTGKIIKTDTSQEIPPTLEELIEACGDWFWSLNKIDGMWYADAETEQSLNCDIGCCGITGVKGSTPSEAVANLWLELKKKRRRIKN